MRKFTAMIQAVTPILLLFAITVPVPVHAAGDHPYGTPLTLIIASDVTDAKAAKDAFALALMSTSSCENGDASKRSSCVCQHRTHWDNFASVLANMLNAHPDWKEKLLKYQSDNQDVSISVNALVSASTQHRTGRCAG